MSSPGMSGQREPWGRIAFRRGCWYLALMGSVLPTAMATAKPEEEGLSELMALEVVRWEDEIIAMERLLLGEGAFSLLADLIAGGVALLIVRWLAQRLLKRGLTLGGWVFRVRTLGMLTIFAITALFVIRRLVVIAPTLTIASLFAILTIGGLASIGLMQSLVAGAIMSFRGDIQEGVIIRLEGHEGIVTHIGPTTLRLQTEDGGQLNLPNHLFLKQPYSVRSPRTTARVSVRYHLDRLPTSEDRKYAEQAGLLCPYRHHSSEVLVRLDESNPNTLAISFVAPNQALVEKARDHVLAALQETIDPGLHGSSL